MDPIYQNKLGVDVAILMATYNGLNFIEEQLRSLQQQTYRQWTLYVQDDLSTDETVACLQRFAQEDDRIVVVPNASKKGAMGNFMDLLEKVDATYYMFCDHDDVWLPNKIEVTLAKMKETEAAHRDVPVIVHTDLRVVDAQLQEICPSFWAMSRIQPDLLHSFAALGGHYLTTGCTMMVNQKAKEVSLPLMDKALMHDAWITCRVLQHGGVVAEVEAPTILYRQHGNNVVGARDIREHYLSGKFRKLRTVVRENKKYYQMLRQLGYGNFFKFLYYKVRYFVIYKK